MSDGWIKLHRKIKNHWLYQDPNLFGAWVKILMEVNHEETMVLIDGELISCKRGESLKSIQSWVKTMGNGWSPKKIRTFFNLLKKDGMIGTEGLRKTTRLTVCNYDNYQTCGQAEGKQKASRGQAEGKQRATNKNEKNDKNIPPIVPQGGWESDFNEYVRLVDEAYSSLKCSQNKKESWLEFFPNGNYELTLKNVLDYWNSHAGWIKKKQHIRSSRKSNPDATINMVETLYKSMKMKFSIIYDSNSSIDCKPKQKIMGVDFI